MPDTNKQSIYAQVTAVTLAAGEAASVSGVASSLAGRDSFSAGANAGELADVGLSLDALLSLPYKLEHVQCVTLCAWAALPHLERIESEAGNVADLSQPNETVRK